MTINWLESTVIEIEVDINAWLPVFTIVWLPDQWVQESKERLRSALKSSSTKLPTSRITVNLAPANIKKSGPSFDLAIAIWILLNEWWITNESFIKDSIFIGELSLDGKLRQVTGVLPIVIWAKEKWFKRIFLPEGNCLEASIIPWIEIIKIKILKDLINILNLEKELDIQEKFDFKKLNDFWKKDNLWELENKYDFKYVLWQEHAKRALEIAAAGWHNIIMEWPPGSWKTMLAKAFSTILPDLSLDEAIEISKIYSISWLLSQKKPIITKRPFRTIHHTASSVSIIWWWRNAKPWEISLAHKWILFLDEILEFQKNVLEVLRQPLEDWYINVTRVNANYNYPAQFSLIWSMNPCPCWYLTDIDKDCKCTFNQVKNYRSRLSWPLVDRIDMFIEVPKVKTEKFKVSEDYSWRETSKNIKTKVEKAKSIQLKRFKEDKITSNSEMQTKDINKYCLLDKESNDILKQAVVSMNLSARSYYRILKLSRTIADLEWNKDISSKHILESLSFRKKNDD